MDDARDALNKPEADRNEWDNEAIRVWRESLKPKPEKQNTEEITMSLIEKKHRQGGTLDPVDQEKLDFLMNKRGGMTESQVTAQTNKVVEGYKAQKQPDAELVDAVAKGNIIVVPDDKWPPDKVNQDQIGKVVKQSAYEKAKAAVDTLKPLSDPKRYFAIRDSVKQGLYGQGDTTAPQQGGLTPEEQRLLDTSNDQLSDSELDQKAELIKRLMAQGQQ